MATTDVDIATQITSISKAVYGEEVRGAICDALTAISGGVNSAIHDQLLVLDSTLSISGQGADSKVTGDAIKDVRRSISQTTALGATFSSSDFVVGGRSSYGGGVSSATNRATTSYSTITFDADTTFHPDGTIQYYFFFSNGTRSGWLTSDYTVSKGTSVSFAIGYADDRTVTSSNIPDLLSRLEMWNPLQTALGNAVSQMADVGNNINAVRRVAAQTATVGYKFQSSDFVVGGRSSYGGGVSSATNRATTTVNILTFDADTKFHPDGTIKYYFYFSDGTRSGWLTGDYTVSEGTSASFVIGYSDDRTVTTSNIPDLLSRLEMWNPLQTEVANNAAAIESVSNALLNDTPITLTSSDWQFGNLSARTSTSLVSATNRITTKNRISVNEGATVHIACPSGYKYRALFFAVVGAIASGYSYTVADVGTNDVTTWHNDASRTINVPSGVHGVAICLARTDDGTMTLAEGAQITIEEVCLSSRIQNAENDIAQLKDMSEAAPYVGKVISILGDSISTFAGNNPASSTTDDHLIADGVYTYAGNHCRYPNSYLTNVHDTYWMKLIDTLGMALGINDSWAGSRVVSDNRTRPDYGANMHISSQTRIGHLGINGTPDIILVNAGTNDIYESTLGTFNTESPKNYTDEQIAALPVDTFADAYRTLLIRLQKTYPLARIVVMLPNYTSSYYNPQKADSYLEIIKEACDYFGVPWVDMRTIGITMYNTSTYMGDGIHPNVSGMNLMEKRLEKFFKYEFYM